MTTTALSPAPARQRVVGFGRLLGSEWLKICSVRSTAWSLIALAVTAIGLNALVTAVIAAHWGSLSESARLSYQGDPTGFLSPAVAVAQIPMGVLGALVVTSEYSTGMIRSSLLAVPRRVPMLAAKAAVFGAIALGMGELLAFPSFLLAKAIIGHHLALSLGDTQVLRAVSGFGLYLAVLGLFSFAIGALTRNIGAAITIIVGVVLVLPSLMSLAPGSLGKHVSAYLPASAGRHIVEAHQEAGDLLSPWQGFGVFCLWTMVLLISAAVLLRSRDV
jgi:ABC-2 type transport system permease protein